MSYQKRTGYRIGNLVWREDPIRGGYLDIVFPDGSSCGGLNIGSSVEVYRNFRWIPTKVMRNEQRGLFFEHLDFVPEGTKIRI